MFQKLTPELRKTKAADLNDCSEMPNDFSKANTTHVAAMFGATEIGITICNLKHSLDRFRSLTNFTTQFEKTHGSDVKVRIRRDLPFEARDNTGISYREFAVLSAVYSCIGAKSYPVRITRKSIQCRMLGYKSPTIMQQELSNRLDKFEPLTLRQINYVLDKLDERRFFARVRANERQTYYSIRMSEEQLEERIASGKTYSETFHENRIKRDAEVMARIKARRSAIKADTAINANNQPIERPNDVNSPSATVSTGSSTGSSTGVSTLIKTPLTETSSIKTPLTQTPSTETPSIGTRACALGVLIPAQKEKLENRTHTAPSSEEVREFVKSLNKKATEQQAEQWFEHHGSDSKWTEHDWRTPCAKWIFDDIGKRKRAQQKAACC